MLRQGQALGRTDMKHGQVSDYFPHAARPGQGEAALGQNLGVALLIDVLL